MIWLLVDNLQDGHVLAQDVVRADGVILMTAGRPITEEAINLLRRLEVKSVVVEGDQFATEEERQAFVQAQEQALDERFSRVQDDKVLGAIREMFRKRLRQGCWPQQGPGESGDEPDAESEAQEEKQ